jgi:hypothetical protein
VLFAGKKSHVVSNTRSNRNMGVGGRNIHEQDQRPMSCVQRQACEVRPVMLSMHTQKERAQMSMHTISYDHMINAIVMSSVHSARALTEGN